MILDGDHNYYTLSEELRLIAERASGARLPLLIFHDIGWPLARRDAYYAPERIPTSTASRWRTTRICSRASRARPRAGCRSPASPRARAGRATGS